MDEASEERSIAHEPDLQKEREHHRQRRAEFTAGLFEKAEPFFVMKSTGAEIIVTIFQSPAERVAVAA